MVGAPTYAGFNAAYQNTLPAIDALTQLHPDDPRCEPFMQTLRDGLAVMEQHTEEMVNMLYEVDVYMAPSTAQSVAGFNPQEALAHVSDLFHVRRSTHPELPSRATGEARGVCRLHLRRDHAARVCDKLAQTGCGGARAQARDGRPCRFVGEFWLRTTTAGLSSGRPAQCSLRIAGWYPPVLPHAPGGTGRPTQVLHPRYHQACSCAQCPRCSSRLR